MNKKSLLYNGYFIAVIGVVAAIPIFFLIFTFLDTPQENTLEKPKIRINDVYVDGELWIITFENPIESFSTSNVNKELKLNHKLSDVSFDPVLQFDTITQVLHDHKYLQIEYNLLITDKTYGLLLLGEWSEDLVKEMLEDIPGVVDVQFHERWSVRQGPPVPPGEFYFGQNVTEGNE